VRARHADLCWNLKLGWLRGVLLTEGELPLQALCRFQGPCLRRACDRTWRKSQGRRTMRVLAGSVGGCGS